MNKQQSIRRRLSAQSSFFTSPITAASTPEEYSTVISPLGLRFDVPLSPSQPYNTPSRPIPVSPGIDHRYGFIGPFGGDGDDTQPSEDVKALYETNQQIKTTLTELLNSPSVKCDEGFRTWVQVRLMDAEREMKRERRRRSSSCADRNTADHIAGSIEHFNFLRMTP